MNDASIEIGTRIGRYRVKSRIAQGGFGVIWRAQDGPAGRVVAIKVLHADLVTSRDIVLRFEREARAITEIRHPNVVELLDFGRLPDGRPYLVMEHLSGVNLDEHLYSYGPMSPAETVEILEPVVDALAIAHRRGIVHRDLKASNVVLAEEGGLRRVVLLDFGIAKVLETGGPQLTGSRMAIGSPVCMAPEQIRGEAVDARTDVYGLGSLAFHMLTGAPPFSGGSITSMDQHLFAQRPRPSEFLDVDSAVDAAVVRAMSKRPEDRYPGVSEFLNAMRSATGAAGARARRGTARETAAIGLYVDVRAAAEVADDPDDAVLDDMEDVFPQAVAYLSQRGFALAYEDGDSALFVQPIDDEADRRATLERAVDVAIVLYERLLAREHHDPRVQVVLQLHVDEVRIAGDVIDGGALLDLGAWAVAGEAQGVIASSALCAELDQEVSKITGAPHARQIYVA